MIKAAKIVRKPHSADNSDHQEPDWEDAFISRRVDCICPKCGVRHRMDFLWVGRGLPRKFCPQCKGRI